MRRTADAARPAARRSTLAAAIRATVRRRGTQLPESEIVALSEQFVQDARAQANWKAYVKREGLRGFESLAQVISRPRARGRTT
jgi:hypothetical protein